MTVKNEFPHYTTACNSYQGNNDHTKQLSRQLPLSAREQLLLLAICAAMATEVLRASAGLHLLLLGSSGMKPYLALSEYKWEQLSLQDRVSY